MMLMSGDFRINSGQHYTDSVKEVLRQTMLHHDAIFRDQVYELHRIYGIQKTLMKDLSWNEFGNFTSWTASTKSISIPFQHPEKSKTLGGDRIFSGSAMVKQVGTTSTTHLNWLEDRRDPYSKHLPFNLQLPADEYIRSAGAEIPEDGNLLPTVNESIGLKEFFRANLGPNPEEVKLSLSVGRGTNKKGCSRRSWHNREASLSPIYVIDSEDSVEGKSDVDMKPVSSLSSEAATAFDGDKNGVQAPFLYNYSFAKPNGINQENKSCCSDTGLNECQSAPRLSSLYTSKPEIALRERGQVDLNRVELDGSSFLSSDPFLSFSSLTESSLAVVGRLSNESGKEIQSVRASGSKAGQSFSDEAAAGLQQDNFLCSSLMDSKCKVFGAQACNVSTKCRENGGNKVVLIDLECLPEELDLCEDFSDQDIKVCKDDVNLSSEFQSGCSNKGFQQSTSDITPISNVESNKPCTSIRCTDSPQAVDDAEVRQINFERSEEDTVSSGPFRSHAKARAENCKLSDATSKTDFWAADNSCCMKGLQAGTIGVGEVENLKSSASEKCVATQLGSRITGSQSSEGKGELDNSKLSASEESGVALLGSELTESHSAEQGSLVETKDYSRPCMEERPSDGIKAKQYHGQQLIVDNEIDILVQKAAESLLYISLDNSYCSQKYIAEASNASEEEMNEQPEYSSDSFESITLKLTECSVDDYSVSSMPVEVKETDKGCGWKLKRGSRLKDFQKDILPGLVSLSRHEICEDINIIGTALRSREYRKNRSRNIGGEKWGVPVKGRRSKLNYIGRRTYY